MCKGYLLTSYDFSPVVEDGKQELCRKLNRGNWKMTSILAMNFSIQVVE
jgi:hypothetical protein